MTKSFMNGNSKIAHERENNLILQDSLCLIVVRFFTNLLNLPVNGDIHWKRQIPESKKDLPIFG